MSSPPSPQSDPDFLKIPAYLRKKAIVQRVKAKAPAAFTVEDALRSVARDGMGEVEISSSFHRAVDRSSREQGFRDQIVSVPRIRQSRSRSVTGKRIITDKPQDAHRDGFGTISLQPSFQQPLLGSENFSHADAKLRSYEEVAYVTAVLPKIDVAILKISKGLRVGDVLLFQSENSMFEDRVDSMQINRKEVKIAKKGAEIGMKVSMLPRSGTKVYRCQR